MSRFRSRRPAPATAMLGDWPIEVIDHAPPTRVDALLVAVFAACAAACALLLLR